MGGFFSLFLKPHKIGVPPYIEHTDEVEESNETPIIDANSMFTKNSNKFALLIGINYISNKSKNDDLNGCVNDMYNLCEFLQNDCQRPVTTHRR